MITYSAVPDMRNVLLVKAVGELTYQDCAVEPIRLAVCDDVAHCLY